MKDFIRVDFNIDIAKRILHNEIEGRIITKNNKLVRILCFDSKSQFPIVGLVVNSNTHHTEHVVNYNESGIPSSYDEKLFTLELEVPEYIFYKEGEIISFGPNNRKHIGILQKFEFSSHIDYVTLSNGKLIFNSQWSPMNMMLATNEEKKELEAALKNSSDEKAKEYLNKFFNNKEQDSQNFLIGDKVLGYDEELQEWRFDFFSHYGKDNTYVCTGRVYKKIKPYNTNK